MTRLWPWSSGAPAETQHTELEEKMSPDVQQESSAYDLQSPVRQAEAAQAKQRQPGAKPQSLQQS
jgi:hypothetical protein